MKYNKINWPGIILLIVFFVIHFNDARAQGKEVLTKHQNDNEKFAIDGYDPVAYFTEEEPLKGKSEFTADYLGLTYRFVNASNRQQFISNPEKYAPQYGGWCAYAMGESGEKVKIDPETYKIIDGKLYLFYNFYFNNTLTKWNGDEDRLKRNADQNWNKTIGN